MTIELSPLAQAENYVAQDEAYQVLQGKKLNRVDWVIERRDIKAAHKMLLMAIAYRANHGTLGAYVKPERMMGEAGLSRQSLTRTLNELNADGWVVTIPLYYRNSGKRAYTWYLLNAFGWLNNLTVPEIVHAVNAREGFLAGEEDISTARPVDESNHIVSNTVMVRTDGIANDEMQGLRLITGEDYDIKKWLV